MGRNLQRITSASSSSPTGRRAGLPGAIRRSWALLPALLLLVIFMRPDTRAAAGDIRCANTQLQVLGSGGPELDDGRRSSAYLLWLDGRARVLLDAGSGSSVAFGAAGADFADLEAILLSHLHTDHAGDVPAFIKGSFFTGRDRDLIIAGPAGNQRMPATATFVDRLMGPDGAFRYLNGYLQAGRERYTLKPQTMSADARGRLDGPAWRARSLPVTHGPIPAIAWRLEMERCVVVYSGDMSGVERDFDAFAAGADLLILHAAIPEDAAAPPRALHMTPAELLAVADRLAPRRVLISHFMKRSETAASQLLTTTVPAVLARDGLVLELGGPVADDAGGGARRASRPHGQ